MRLTSRGGADYRSYVAPDRIDHDFRTRFVVPTDALDESGIAISVADADDDEPDGRLIGQVRFSRSALLEAAGSGAPALYADEQGGLLRAIEVTVREHDGSYRQKRVRLNIKDTRLVAVEAFPVYAGEIVRVEAQGSYNVSSGDDMIGTDGYTDGSRRGYNLKYPAFKTANHGAAVAVVGEKGAVDALVVGSCVKIVNTHSGWVWVGLNDDDPGNNDGEIEFVVKKRAANAKQWNSPGARLPCD